MTPTSGLSVVGSDKGRQSTRSVGCLESPDRRPVVDKGRERSTLGATMVRSGAAAAAVSASAVMLAWLVGTGLAGCGSPPPRAPVQAPRPASKPAPAEPKPALPPLTPREKALEPELRGYVQELAGKIGERNPKQMWELASAADYLANAFEDMGYRVERQGFEVDGVLAMNLSVSVAGGERGDELVVVGAHYDSAEGSPSADSASGAAAVLALARHEKELHRSRSLRFVEFVNGEPPYYQTDNMGSVHYAKALAARSERVTAMLDIDGIGYYPDAPDSQHFPADLASRYPRAGSFVAFTGRSGDTLAHRVVTMFRGGASIPAEAVELPADMKNAGWSDNWAFWQFGFPAVMVSDTGAFRYPHYRTAQDTPDKLDYGRMARVVAGLEDVLDELTLRRDTSSKSAVRDAHR